MTQILITKADGNRVPFDPEKLRKSLHRAGAEEGEIVRVIKAIEAKLTDGMTTSQIYKDAFSMLKKEEPALAAKYSMKRALLSLGPSGFPFEHFVAEIFKAQGYTVQTGVGVRGACVHHEVDLIARKGATCIGAEIKFHNRLGTKSDVKDALYVRARFEDIAKAEKTPEMCIDEGWFITNTKFTKNALTYGKCVGLRMLSWGYPHGGNGSLADLIRETRIQPVTALTTLSQTDKKRLLEKNVVLCKTVHQHTDALQSLGLSDKKIEAVMKESAAVCG